MSGPHPIALQVLDPRLGTEFPLPQYATVASAGLDLRAMLDAPLTLDGGATALVPRGMAFHRVGGINNSPYSFSIMKIS